MLIIILTQRMKSDKYRLINALKKRIDDIAINGGLLGEKIIDEQIAVLLSELKIAQIELELQNDGLSNAAQLLETERSKFAGFFNLAPIGYFILNFLGEVHEANQAGLELFETDIDTIKNQRFQSFIAPEHWERFYGFLHKLQPNEAKQSIEIKIALVSNKVIYAKIKGIAIDNPITRKIQYYLTVSDITTNRSAHRELKNTTQRLALTLEASGMGTWTIDLHENRIFLDNYGLSLLEIHPWDFDGSIKKFIENIYPADQFQVKEHFLNHANHSQKIDVEFRILTADGNIKYFVVQGCLVDAHLPKLFFAGVIIDISERKRHALIEKELAEETQKLILSTTINVQEKERQKIGSILHDSICQLLYGIRLNLQNVSLGHKAPNDFKNVHELLALAIKETRELSYELVPSVLRDFGLTEGILEMAKRLSTSAFKINTQIGKEVDKLDSDLQLSIFRTVQELINNCIKHANATNAEIRLSLIKHKIEIIVKDNGVGFEHDLENSIKTGTGLRSLKNRIFLLNGDLDLKTGSKGTEIKIMFEVN